MTLCLSVLDVLGKQNEPPAWGLEDSLYLSSQGSLELEAAARGDPLLCKASRSHGEAEIPSYAKGARALKGEADTIFPKHKSYLLCDSEGRRAERRAFLIWAGYRICGTQCKKKM